MNNQDALTTITGFFDTDAVSEVLVKTCFGASWFREGGRANHTSWATISDAENDFAAPLVSQRNAVVGQSFKMIIIYGALEFEPFAFRFAKPTGYLLV